MMYRHSNVWRNSNVMRCNMNRCISMHHRYFGVMNEWRFNVMMDRGVVMNNWRFMVDRYSNLRWCRYIMVNHCFNHMSL